MSKYVFLLYGVEADWEDTPENWEASMAQHAAFAEAVAAAGASIVGGEALTSTPQARTVRDHTLVTDGPFAETKEQLGAFYVIEAADLEQALALAKQVPETVVEVRPVIATG
ncbi:YciI family protein [Fodinicola acaciae]|uniref:YciI family protein n=1 Tax=Fodinicola acaciae TaxID=2681555 RepID=UPI0013D3F5FC|nr:YciI family protein [Fodinicola acaciae]